MGKVKDIAIALTEHNIDYAEVDVHDLLAIHDLAEWFENLDYAVEAWIKGYNKEELESKGPYPAYWIYLLWVK